MMENVKLVNVGPSHGGDNALYENNDDDDDDLDACEEDVPRKIACYLQHKVLKMMLIMLMLVIRTMNM